MKFQHTLKSLYILLGFVSVLCFASCSLDEMDKEISISGKVTDQIGSPISDVLVTLEFANMAKETTHTQANGSYSITTKEKGLAYIEVKHDDFQSVKEKITVHYDSDKLKNFTLNHK